jgi:hypothetical protein
VSGWQDPDATEPFHVPDTWTGKPLPPEFTVPWWVRVAWRIQIWVTWPRQVREMKAAGFIRTGWMTWETPGPR